MGKKRKALSLLLAIVIAFGQMPRTDLCVQAATTPVTLTFSDSKIAATVSGSGYSINGTTLQIESNGVYKVTGSCLEGSIEVKKQLDNVVLILNDLTLTSSTTAPVTIKKGSSVILHLDGTTTLTNDEDPSNETSTDTTIAEAFEGAAVKVKSGSTLTVCGDGTLNVYGKAKNGIKGAEASSLTVNSGTINVKEAANNGIAFDGSITINGGTLGIAAENDGMKAVPDADDVTSEGNITINGGIFDIDTNGDGIQAEQNLTIRGGTFQLNTADDAIHSDTYATITGGTFDIYTGDDGVHADTTLILGVENGYARDPEITISSSYEGLEAGTIYAYSGKYYVVASDDGINAAGGSSNGSDPGSGGDNNFNPGGGRPGGGPGGRAFGGGTGNSSANTAGDYNIYFYGGDFYVNCQGDGLDSNGNLYLYGGNFTVLSQGQGGDNSPLDADGTVLIDGATVFAAGTNPMNQTLSSSSQKYTTAKTSYSTGTIINVTSGGNTLYTEKLVRNVNYMLYSSPTVSSTVSFGSGSLNACNSDAWAHNWDKGTVVTAATETSEGKLKCTCQDCEATEYKTIPVTTSVPSDVHENSETPSEEPSETPSEKPSETPSEEPSETSTEEPSETDTAPERLTQKGVDGTSLGKGASFEAADDAITHLESDADPAGSVYRVLCARAAKVTNSSIKLTWKKTSGAVKYVIYAGKCGKKNTYTKVATVTKNTYTYKKLKKGTYYKFMVVALDNNNNVISTSKMVHAATGSGKVGNYKSISIKGGTKITVNLRKTYTLKGKAVQGSLKVKSHRAVSYETSDTSVATVTKKGVVKGVGKGTCYMYVYAQNGIYKRVKVTVK